MLTIFSKEDYLFVCESIDYNRRSQNQHRMPLQVTNKQSKLTGAPENPINGTFPSNLCRVSVIASIT